VLTAAPLLQVAPTFGRVGGFLRSIEEEMNNMLQVGDDPTHVQYRSMCAVPALYCREHRVHPACQLPVLKGDQLKPGWRAQAMTTGNLDQAPPELRDVLVPLQVHKAAC
jgi:hypothetical protein